MECNIGQEAIFLLIGNAQIFRYIYKGRPVKISANTAFFILQRNVHEIFDTIS
jgi:hypothetical protein